MTQALYAHMNDEKKKNSVESLSSRLDQIVDRILELGE
jgi:hypothetical protein